MVAWLSSFVPFALSLLPAIHGGLVVVASPARLAARLHSKEPLGPFIIIIDCCFRKAAIDFTRIRLIAIRAIV